MNRHIMIVPLTSGDEKRRAMTIVALGTMLVTLAFLPPTIIPSWLHPSCGAVTGLPCIFCGATRAMHLLLSGKVHAALYYNWLALPIVAGAAGVMLLYGAELGARRKLVVTGAKPRLTARTLGVLLAGTLLLWALQVYLAVSQHKSELLNPNGILYSLVVRLATNYCTVRVAALLVTEPATLVTTTLY